MKHMRGFLIAIVAALVVAVPLLYSSHRQTTMRNFHVVEEGVLYRSGQLSPAAFEQVLNDRGIKTVVTLRTVRDKTLPYPDDFERQICEAHGLKHIRIEPLVWSPDEHGDIPAEQNVAKFLELMSDSNRHPVLVHCFAGVHRTGTMCAIYRMEAYRWSAERAIVEMQACGFDSGKDAGTKAIENYLRNYQPRWLKRP